MTELQWIVDGYSTLLNEIDEQLGQPPDLIVTPIGVGSLGQAVVSHSKSRSTVTKVLAVEPDTAACLLESLKAGKPTKVLTGNTIMAGMNCATVSILAWPILYAGVDASTTVSDSEAHDAVEYLKTVGMSAGPCGAATLAGLRHVARTDPSAMGLHEEAVVVLICTEGAREYAVPREASPAPSTSRARPSNALSTAPSSLEL